MGSERDFYSTLADEEVTETLDDKITEHEREVQTQLGYLLALPPQKVADAAVAAKLVAHLVTRNDHFRRAATAAGEALFQGFAENLSSEDKARRMLGLSRDKPTATVQKALSEALDENPGIETSLGIPRGQLEELLFQIAKSKFPEMHRSIAESSREAFEGISEKLGYIGADAQKKALEKNLVPPLRVEKLIEHSWTVQDSTCSLVMPDCIAISSSAAEKKRPLMFAEDDPESVWMPLSKSRLLVGTRREEPPRIDFRYLNREMAQCAWDFVVSDVDAILPTALGRQIRKRSRAIIAEIVRTAFFELS